MEKGQKSKKEMIEKMVEDYKKNLEEIFDEKTSKMTFTEREKMILEKLIKPTTNILSEHIKENNVKKRRNKRKSSMQVWDRKFNMQGRKRKY